MFGKGWKIATIGGIPIRVDGSWLVFAALVGYLQYSAYVVQHHATQQTATALSLFSIALFFGSIFMHELAHAGVGRALNIPVKGITLLFWGGFTEVAADDHGPRASFLVSTAGPATSLLIGIALTGLGTMMQSGSPGLLPLTIQQVGIWNLYIAVLNALPGFPLDGGRMLKSIVWGFSHKRSLGTKVAAVGGQIVGGLLIAAGVLQIYKQNIFGAIWFAYIGMFLIRAAKTSEKQELARERLIGATVADVMQEPPPSIRADISLLDSFNQFLQGHEQELFPVVDGGGQLVGALNFEAARKIGQGEPDRQVRDAMIPVTELVTVQSGDRLDEAAGQIRGAGALVLRDGILVGAISGHLINRWMQLGPAAAGGT